MRLAWLDADAVTWNAIQGAVASGQAVLAWASNLGEFESAARALAPAARYGEPWEILLAGDLADWVIVGRRGETSEEIVAERLGKLLRGGVRLAVSYPQTLDVLAAYELEMVREEAQATLRPIVPVVDNREAQRLIDSVGGRRDFGAVEQVVLQRGLDDPTRETVLRALAGDLLLARRLAGELTRVAALAPAGEQIRYDQLGVQLSGPHGALVRWSVQRGETGLQVTVLGSEERTTLRIAEESNFDPLAKPPDEAFSWQESIRGLEWVDAVERSLRRGKTIDLAANEANETGAFKALMSAAGCLLLLVAPLLFVVGLGVAQIKPLQPLVRIVPLGLALLLAAFLGLQTLRGALPKEPRSRP